MTDELNAVALSRAVLGYKDAIAFGGEHEEGVEGAIRAYMSALPPQRRAPVQGFSAGIPWSMHLRAYDAYVKRHGRQDALIDLEGRNCRGGFGVNELDAFIPGWREELSE